MKSTGAVIRQGALVNLGGAPDIIALRGELERL
jgi:hypothetical protein